MVNKFQLAGIERTTRNERMYFHWLKTKNKAATARVFKVSKQAATRIINREIKRRDGNAKV